MKTLFSNNRREVEKSNDINIDSDKCDKMEDRETSVASTSTAEHESLVNDRFINNDVEDDFERSEGEEVINNDDDEESDGDEESERYEENDNENSKKKMTLKEKIIGKIKKAIKRYENNKSKERSRVVESADLNETVEREEVNERENIDLDLNENEEIITKKQKKIDDFSKSTGLNRSEPYTKSKFESRQSTRGKKRKIDHTNEKIENIILVRRNTDSAGGWTMKKRN
ncbi:Protein of unknown function [Cotesia congregata]|uniref:Uncharacterized protein n=1 Tax=Cotesia congregata TaxID=51543 RepID=A0A8J2HGD7_COTCN|nr:Protein of unknown function [Cotesia congregata]